MTPPHIWRERKISKREQVRENTRVREREHTMARKRKKRSEPEREREKERARMRERARARARECVCVCESKLVSSLKTSVTFAEYSLFHRALLQKRPMFEGSLLIVAAS